MKDRSSFAFFLWKTTKVVLVPFVLLTVVFCAFIAMQRGIHEAWNVLQQLIAPEIVLWLLITFAMLMERRISTRFTAVQDEIAELKERISNLETRR